MHGSNGLVHPWKSMDHPISWRGLKKFRERKDGCTSDDIGKSRRSRQGEKRGQKEAVAEPIDSEERTQCGQIGKSLRKTLFAWMT
jgi:hypothetical protein